MDIVWTTRRRLIVFGLVCVAITFLQYQLSHGIVTAISSTNEQFLSEIPLKALRSFQSNEQCDDTLIAADHMLSSISIQGSSSVFLGEYVLFTVVLFNGYGIQKDTGGDQLRARLYNNVLKAYTPGTIFDHDNGTYTVAVQALWTGQAQLQVEILYTKEVMIPTIRLRRTWDCTNTFAVFSNNALTEKTACGPDYKTVLKYSKRSKVCDFSYWNKSLKWFCVEPSNNLTCYHWSSIARNWENYTSDLSKCEEELSQRDPDSSIPSKISIQIRPRANGTTPYTAFEDARIPCSSYNRTALWFKVKPTGYFYKNKWILTHCKGIKHFQTDCFRNKTVLFWGDSTLHQWFKYLKKQLHTGRKYVCKRSNGPSDWRTHTTCYYKEYNLTLSFFGHNIPVSRFSKPNLQSMFEIIGFEEFIKSKSPQKHEFLLVINLYSHLQQYNYNHFTSHMMEIKKSLERIFAMKYNVNVFIKLPHTYRRVKDIKWKIRQNDFIGFIYTSIMRKVFKGLYHRVTVLDQKDATIAIRSFPLHPSNEIVREMVLQFLSYACKSY
ncbi:NXPE family member 2-like [Ruditapes philippinarum]|uniref:NXPE family member 2-like n=1 Tax=Ruditapes philippinarum TaxID=129788 RepID=UPI00295B6AAC|nr:NXPE family member 2-like [Ruditapes philippinarum]